MRVWVRVRVRVRVRTLTGAPAAVVGEELRQRGDAAERDGHRHQHGGGHPGQAGGGDEGVQR